VQAESLKEVVVEALEGMEDNVFIEDSGLFVEDLNGFPGVYSSYVFKTIGWGGILKLLEGSENRKAYFESVVGLKMGGEIKVFEGRVEGSIAMEARGDGGFGYDPVFIPRGSEETFAENPGLKNEVSHRRKALEKLDSYLSTKLW